MKFNYWVAGIFIAVWLIQVVLSILEDTFYSKYYNANLNLDLPLSRHWGVLIGDPILAIMNGYIFPHLNLGWHSLFFLLVSAWIGWMLHKSWWNIRGHIFPNHDYSDHKAAGRWDQMKGVRASQKKYWYHDHSDAGWCHLIFLILQLEIIFEFIATPMPASAVQTATVFLLIFAPFGVFQPGWAEWLKKIQREPKATWFWRSFISLIVMWAAIIATWYFKI